MTTQHIHWSNLVASPRNVRKIKAGIDSLAASIAADGLLHALTVTSRADGKSEVVAGERRRRAIIQLVRAGTWPRDTHVPCEVREGEDATAISYAENAQRVAMHPADAIRAFATLASEGHDEAAIANRYGYDPREVRKMLTLASLSRRVLNALAADRIDVATAQAFTLTDDHKRQEQVLRVARGAHEVRRLLTDTKVTTGHRLFRFIGADAYAEAGGGITRDLFANEGEGYADDPALVQRLADARFAALASEAEGAGWSEVIASEQTPYESYQWHQLYPDDGEGYAEGTKAGAVLLITVAGDGTPATIAYTRKAKRTAPSESHGTPLPRPLYGAQSIEALSRIRTAALQSEVARNQRVANAVLLDALLPIVRDRHAPSHAVQLRAGPGIQQPAQVHAGNTLRMASPFDGVAAILAEVPDQPETRFAWLLSLDTDATARLLAACAGGLIDATEGKFADRSRLRSADRIARAVNLDMRQHWKGGVEFFGGLGKKALLAGLTEACGQPAAENCAKLKHGDLAHVCAERIPGRGWLPPILRTPELEPEVDEAEEFEAIADVDGDDEGYLEYDPANDEERFAVAAE